MPLAVRLRTAAAAQQSLAADQRSALCRDVRSMLSPAGDEAETTAVEVGQAALEFLETGISQGQHDPQSLHQLLEFAFVVFDGAQTCEAAKPLVVRTAQMEQAKQPSPVEMMMKKFIDAVVGTVKSSQQPEAAQALAHDVMQASRRNIQRNAGEYCFGVSYREGVVQIMSCVAEQSSQSSTVRTWGRADNAVAATGEQILGPAILQCMSDVQSAMQNGQEHSAESVKFCVTTLRRAITSSEAWSRSYGFLTLRLVATMIKAVSGWPVMEQDDTRERLLIALRKQATLVLGSAPASACRSIVEWCGEAWAADKAETTSDAHARLDILVHLMNHAEPPSNEGGSPRYPLRAGLIRSDSTCLRFVVEQFMRGMQCCYAQVLHCPTDARPGIYLETYRALCSCFLNWPPSQRKEMEECLLRWGLDRHVLCSAMGGDIWACMLRIGTLQGENDTLTALVFQTPSQGLQVCRRPEATALSRLVLHIEPDLSPKARHHIARWLMGQLTPSGDLEGAAAVLSAMPFRSFQREIQGPMARAVGNLCVTQLASAAIEKAPMQVTAIAECARAILRTSQTPQVELWRACRDGLLGALRAAAARRDKRLWAALIQLAGAGFARQQPSAASDTAYIELCEWLSSNLAQCPDLGAASAACFLSDAGKMHFSQAASRNKAHLLWIDVVRFLAAHEDWAVRHLLLSGVKLLMKHGEMSKDQMKQLVGPLHGEIRSFLGDQDNSRPEEVLAGLVSDQEIWQQLSRKRKRAEVGRDSVNLTESEEALFQNLAKRVKGIKDELARLTGALGTMCGAAPADKVSAMQTSLAQASDALAKVHAAV